MSEMFFAAKDFNQDIKNSDIKWDVSKVTSMNSMFATTSGISMKFNGDIRNWNLGSNVDLKYMFQNNTTFNRYVSDWEVSTNSNLESMFMGATSMSGVWSTRKGWDEGSNIPKPGWPSTDFFKNYDPQITEIFMKSSNTGDNTIAISDNDVTLTFNTNGGNKPIVKFYSGGNQIINHENVKTTLGTNYVGTNGTKKVTSTYTAKTGDTDGLIIYLITYASFSGFKNAFSGKIIDYIKTENNIVNFDDQLPGLSYVSIKSNNAYDRTLAKVSDVITLTIIAEEKIQSPSVIFYSNGSSIINQHAIQRVNTTGNTWVIQYTVNQNDTEGPITYSINFTDAGGLSGNAVSNSTDGTSVIFSSTISAYISMTQGVFNNSITHYSEYTATFTTTSVTNSFTLDDIVPTSNITISNFKK